MADRNLANDSGNVDAIYDGLAYSGIAFGALATLAPRVFTTMYGLKGGGDGNLRIMVRLWGTSIGMLGTIAMLTTDKAARRKLGTAISAMNLVDAVLTLNSGPDISARGRVLGAATSAAFGAAGVYWLTQSD